MVHMNHQTTRGRRSVILYVLAISAIILAVVLIGAKLSDRSDLEDQMSELDEKDLIAITNKRRLPSAFTPVAEATGPWAIEAKVYVPVYSSIYAGKGVLRSDLAVTLSIRNTSFSEAIVVRDVSYFDTDGKLVSRFVEQSHQLGPMTTVEFFIDETDIRGGTGANFLVDWAAGAAVSEPVIEAVMIGAIGAKGFSFVSRGVTTERGPAKAAPAAE